MNKSEVRVSIPEQKVPIVHGHDRGDCEQNEDQNKCSSSHRLNASERTLPVEMEDKSFLKAEGAGSKEKEVR